MNNLAVKVENISKTFKIPDEKRDTFREYFFNLLKLKRHHRFKALNNISFEINKGEWLGIIGRNGSGKSTLLKILAGIYRPDSGSMFISGKMVPFLELGVGFNPNLSARENIFLNGTILGLTNKKINRKFSDIVQFAEIEKFLDTPLKNFSSGMQVRLAFAIAIQAEADVYLLDEVLAVGDNMFQRKCFKLFKDFKKAKKTVLFVSHSLESISEFCTKAVLLENGKLEMFGSSTDVIRRYEDLDLRKEEKTQIKQKKEESFNTKNEWGDRKVIITNVWLEGENGKKRSVFKQCEDLIINVKCEFKSDILDPIFGIVIRDANDQQIFSTNTMWQKKNIKSSKRGERKIISYKINKIPLPDGRYSVSPAIASENGRTMHDWKNNWYSFVVMGKRNTTNFFNFYHSINIKNV